MKAHGQTFNFCPQCCGHEFVSTNGHHYCCKNCTFEYFHNTASAVAAIICFKDEILFTVRAKAPAKGMLDLPGGFVDHNEPLEHALSRELREELGLDIQHWQYFCSDSNPYIYRDVAYQTCVAIFKAVLIEKPKLRIDSSEIKQFKWVPKHLIDTTEIGFISLKNAIEKYLSQIN